MKGHRRTELWELKRSLVIFAIRGKLRKASFLLEEMFWYSRKITHYFYCFWCVVKSFFSCIVKSSITYFPLVVWLTHTDVKGLKLLGILLTWLLWILYDITRGKLQKKSIEIVGVFIHFPVKQTRQLTYEFTILKVLPFAMKCQCTKLGKNCFISSYYFINISVHLNALTQH